MHVVTLEASTNEATAHAIAEVLEALPKVFSIEVCYTGPLHGQHIKGFRLICQDSIDTETLVRQCQIILPTLNVEVTDNIPVEETNWENAWKDHWGPTPVSDTLIIVPSWVEYTAPSNTQTLLLDPGMAFGTGTHPTTQLMLRTMEVLAEDEDFSQKIVLDIGCGSGILSIYAAMLGSQSVRAVDIDPRAVEGTFSNAKLNTVAHAIDVDTTPLEDLCYTPYDLVLCNIVAPILTDLLDDLVLRLAPGGTLLLSGLVPKTVEGIESQLIAAGFDDITHHTQDNWIALQVEKSD